MSSASCSAARSATVTRRCRSPRGQAGAFGGELGGVDPGRDDPDGAAGDAEPGQVGLLVVAAGHDGVDGAADGGLEADPLGAGPAGISPWRRSVTPSWSNDWTTGICRSRAADRAARPLVQRSACTTSGRSLPHCSRSGSLNAPIWLTRRESSRAGVGRADVLDADAGGELGPLRQRLAVAPRVDRHLVALAGQALAHLHHGGVVACGGVSVSVGTGVLCWATRAIFMSGMPLLVNGEPSSAS